eukprot:988914-Prorocentrum_minimum.AAC.1
MTQQTTGVSPGGNNVAAHEHSAHIRTCSCCTIRTPVLELIRSATGLNHPNMHETTTRDTKGKPKTLGFSLGLATLSNRVS